MPAKQDSAAKAPTKKKQNALEKVGGELRWTEKGLHLFFPAAIVGHWTALSMEVNDDIIILKKREPKKAAK
ncbi:MAG: hypothetical protein Q8K67_05840 [Geothrix sp.]|nr:hypothetical protein [Geothrix sp.]